MIVLDTSALLAFLFREEGHQTVARFLQNEQVVMSTVNMAEAVTKFVALGQEAEAAGAILRKVPVTMAAFDQAQALRAGDLVRQTKAYGLSLGDRACLALAMVQKDVGVVTADRVWSNLEKPLAVTIHVIR